MSKEFVEKKNQKQDVNKNTSQKDNKSFPEAELYEMNNPAPPVYWNVADMDTGVAQRSASNKKTDEQSSFSAFPVDMDFMLARTYKGNDTPVNDNPALEKEADRMGEKVAQGKKVDKHISNGVGKGIQKKEDENDEKVFSEFTQDKKSPQSNKNAELSSLINKAFRLERQRTIANTNGYYDPYYEEQNTITVDFNGIQKFQKGYLAQREFWYNNIKINAGDVTLQANVLFKPTAKYDRNIVKYIEYPARQPINPNRQAGGSIFGYGLYLMNNTNNWALVTILFNNKSDYQMLYNYLLGGE